MMLILYCYIAVAIYCLILGFVTEDYRNSDVGDVAIALSRSLICGAFWPIHVAMMYQIAKREG